MPILRPHAARFHERRISSVTFTSAHLYDNAYIPVGVAHALTDSSDFGLLARGAKFTKLGDFLPSTPMNRRANLTPLISPAEKSVTAKTNKHTNSKGYIHTLPSGMCG